MGEGREVDIAEQRACVVRRALVGPVDFPQPPGRGCGGGDDLQRRDAEGLRIGLVDGDRPGAVRMAVGGPARGSVDRPHPGPGIGGDRGGVERRVLDVVAHRLDEAVADRLDVQQGAAVVDMLMGIPPLGNKVGDVGSAPPLPHSLADRVAAVAVFGNPATKFGNPVSAAMIPFAGKAIDLCADGDPICSQGRNPFAHTSYEKSNLVGQAAGFVAGLL
ncbi:MAG: cutinase family protein [Mycobacterium sp.]|nr:cutinase family protein [Mycobacterium sp.]